MSVGSSGRGWVGGVGYVSFVVVGSCVVDRCVQKHISVNN